MTATYVWKRESMPGPRQYALWYMHEGNAWRVGYLKEAFPDRNVWHVRGPDDTGTWETLAILELPLKEAKPAAKLILTAR